MAIHPLASAPPISFALVDILALLAAYLSLSQKPNPAIREQRVASRVFGLMEQYGDHLMDLADASLIVAGESLRTTKIFTLDLAGFNRYRFRRGNRHVRVDIIG